MILGHTRGSNYDIFNTFDESPLCCKNQKEVVTPLEQIQKENTLSPERIQSLWRTFRRFVWSMAKLLSVVKAAGATAAAPVDAHALDQLSYNPLKEHSRKLYVLLPTSKYREIWEIIRSFFFFLDYLATYYIYFFETRDFLILNLLLIPLGLDIIYRFFLAYYEDIKLVLSLKKTIIKYLLGSFVIDLLATIPFYLWIDPFWLCLRFLRMYRIGELCAMIISLQNIICHVLRTSISGTKSIGHLIILIFYMSLFTHIASCYWVYLGREVNGWIKIETEQMTLDPESNLSLYVASAYMVLTTLTSVGYGDIVGSTWQELAVLMILEIVGLWCYCALLWDINIIIEVYSKNKEAAKEDELGIWLLKLDRNQGIRLKPEYFVHIIAFYHQFWLKNLSSVKQDRFYELLTPQIQHKLIDHLYQEPVFDKFNVFFDGLDNEFRRNIATNLEYCEVTKLSNIDRFHQSIIEKGKTVHNMYFIIEGKVKICSRRNIHEYTTIGEGSFFGESNLLFGYPSSYTFRTDETKNFLNCCKSSPSSLELLKERALSRRRGLREIKQACLEEKKYKKVHAKYIGRKVTKAALVGAFGAGTRVVKENINLNESALTFSSHEEDYFEDMKSERDKKSPPVATEQPNGDNPKEPINTTIVTTQRSQGAENQLIPKEQHMTPLTKRAIQVTDQKEVYAMRTNLLLNLQEGTFEKPCITSSLGSPDYTKAMNKEYNKFMKRRFKLDQYAILREEQDYNSEEEYGLEDAMKKERETLIKRVIFLENGVEDIIEHFDRQIWRVKKRIKKVIHIVNEILA